MKRLIIILILITSGVFAQQARERISGGFGEFYMSPVFSPDGSMLAYTSEKYEGIWIYNLSDGSVRQITDESAAGFGFSWSQDSRNILTRVARYEDMKRFNAVKIFDVNSGESQNLSGYKTFMPVLPQWSNGDSKVYTYTKKLELYNTGKIAKAGSLPNSAFVMNNKIAVGDAGSEKFNTFQPIADANYLNLKISPDGSKIVFEISGGNMYVINSDGSGLINLGKGNRPRWSFDSKSIIYMITEDDGHTFTASDIYAVNADGSGKRKLTDTKEQIEMNPCFAPDGKSIVFDDFSDGGIYIMKID